MESKILSFLKKGTKGNDNPFTPKKPSNNSSQQKQYDEESELHIHTSLEYFEHSDYNTSMAVKTKRITEQKN